MSDDKPKPKVVYNKKNGKYIYIDNAHYDNDKKKRAIVAQTMPAKNNI